jgi:hypothetical protein
VLTLLLGSENNSISNIKSTITIQSALINEQSKVKELGFREKGLAQRQYSIYHIEGYYILTYNKYKQDLHSSIIEKINKVHSPVTMNIYFIWDRQNRKDYQE